METVKHETFREAMTTLAKFRSYNNMSKEIIIVDTKANISKMVDSFNSDYAYLYDSISYQRDLVDGLNPVLKNVEFYKYLGHTIIFIEKEELIPLLVKDKP